MWTPFAVACVAETAITFSDRASLFRAPDGTGLATGHYELPPMTRHAPSTALQIERAIVRLRGQNVMLDRDLAGLYGVAIKVLNQAARRNVSRFPADFMFQLSADEANSLRSQFVTLNVGRGTHRKYAPFAFTEQRVAMLSSVLRSPRAIAVNIEIMRAFVQLRRMLDSNVELARKIRDLERKYDGQFRTVFDAIRALMSPPTTPRRAIGFRSSRTPK